MGTAGIEEATSIVRFVNLAQKKKTIAEGVPPKGNNDVISNPQMILNQPFLPFQSIF